MSETSSQAAERGAMAHRKIVMREKKEDKLKHISIGPLPLEFVNSSGRLQKFLNKGQWGQEQNEDELKFKMFNMGKRKDTTISDLRHVDKKCRDALEIVCVPGYKPDWDKYIPLRMKNVSHMELLIGQSVYLTSFPLQDRKGKEFKPAFHDEWKYERRKKWLTLSRVKTTTVNHQNGVDDHFHELVSSVNNVTIAPGETFKVDLSVDYNTYLDFQTVDQDSPWFNLNVATQPSPMFLNFVVPARHPATMPADDNDTTTEDWDNVFFYLLLDNVEVTYARRTKKRIEVPDNRIRFTLGSGSPSVYHYDSDEDGTDEHLSLDTLEL
jgi:hypothetical protein